VWTIAATRVQGMDREGSQSLGLEPVLQGDTQPDSPERTDLKGALKYEGTFGPAGWNASVFVCSG
jgi:hypothetical protein